MGYPKDLDEYSDAALQAEMERRVRARDRGLCAYCGYPRNRSIQQALWERDGRVYSSSDGPCKMTDVHGAIRPSIVVLCGSTRFKDAFEQTEATFGKQGVIVLTVSLFGHSGDLTAEECTDGHSVKTALDNLHKRKIDLADWVYVVDGANALSAIATPYVGTSTRSEIEYAYARGKPVHFMSDGLAWMQDGRERDRTKPRA